MARMPLLCCLLSTVCCGYEAVSRNAGVEEEPRNVWCFVKVRLPPYVTCCLDHAEESKNVTSEVTMKQDGIVSVRHHREDLQSSPCEYVAAVNLFLPLTVSVKVSHSKQTLHFENVWTIVKYDPPGGVRMEPDSGGLRVSWRKPGDAVDPIKLTCQVKSPEGSSFLPEVNVTMMDEEHSMVYSSSYVKPCTNYTVAVRCVDVLGTVWSDWAQTDTALSSLDVRSSGLSLWRRLFKTNETGYRTMHLMWKGPPSHCHAIDEYRLYVDTSLPEVLGPVHNHTIVLNESSHEIIVGAYKNGSELYNETLKIPATENDLPSVEELVALATDGKVFISWDAPALPMNDYMVIWFAEDYLYKWDQTQETNFSFLGAPFRLYTVIVTPVHINGLAGKESLLRVYAEEGAPARATGITVPELDATWATVEWDPVSAEECCGYVVNYTVLYKARDDPNHQGLPFVEERMVVESRELKPGEKVRVQLKNLQPNTTYTVYIMTSSIAGFNKSSLNTFTTKLFGQRFIIGLVLAAVGAVIFFILCLSGLILWMKTANRLIPDPGFSSLAEWPPKNWKKINLMNVWEASEPGDAILADHMCNMKEKQPLNMKPTENCMDVCDWTGSSQTTVSGEDTNCWSGMTDTTLLSKSSGYEDPPRNPPGSAMRESKQQAHITPHENFLHDARSNGLSKWHPGQEGMSTTETIMPYISLDTSEK